MNILVTGATGQLGQEIQSLSQNYPNNQFFFADSEKLNITDFAKVQDFFTQNKINLCLNCAAYTAVDKAEEEKEIANLVNVKGVENLAKASANSDAVLVHISTDYVFDGTNHRPLIEDDQTNPVNFYGQSKLDGEKMALENNPKTFIFRTSWVYSSFGKNFVKTMQKLGSERESLNIIFDQIGTPTYARDLASTIMEITINQKRNEYGIYNYSNEGVASWYDFAVEIFEQSGITCQVNPIETYQYPTPAKRPHYSVLNKAKFKETFNLKINHWKKSLKGMLSL